MYPSFGAFAVSTFPVLTAEQGAEMIALVIITLILGIAIFDPSLTALGRVTLFVIWLAFTALCVATATPSPRPTPTAAPWRSPTAAPWDTPKCSPTRAAWTTPTPYGAPPALRCWLAEPREPAIWCCYEWRGSIDGSGAWRFLDCE